MIAFRSRTWIPLAFFIPVVTSTGCMGHWLSPSLRAPLVGTTTPSTNPTTLHRNPPLVTNGPKPPSSRQTPEVSAVVPHGEPQTSATATTASATPTPKTPDGPTVDSIHAMVATVQDSPPSVAAAAASSLTISKPRTNQDAAKIPATEPPLEPLEHVDQAPVPSELSQRLTAPLEGNSVADIVQFSTPEADSSIPPTPVAKSVPRSPVSKSTKSEVAADSTLIRFRDDASDSLPAPPPELQTKQALSKRPASASETTKSTPSKSRATNTTPSPTPAPTRPSTEKGWTAVTTDSLQPATTSDNTEDL